MDLKIQINKSGYTSIKRNSNELSGDTNNLAWYPDHRKHQGLEREGGLPIAEELVDPLRAFTKEYGIKDYKVKRFDVEGLGAKGPEGQHSDLPLYVEGLSACDVISFFLYLANGDEIGVYIGNKDLDEDALNRSPITRLISTSMKNKPNVKYKEYSI